MIRLRPNAEGKRMLDLLVTLGYRLAQARAAYRVAQTGDGSEENMAERKALAEWDYLREEQIRIIRARLMPEISLRRELTAGQVVSLKLCYKPEGRKKNKTPKIDPALDAVVSEAINRGDTLAQILHTIEVGERCVPSWVKEWEASNYDADMMPPSFPEWATLDDV